MTARSIRRAVERKQKKLARKAEQQNFPTTSTSPVSTIESDSIDNRKAAPISAARLAANRANALHSTGTHSDQGKAAASLNAVKTGLTGRTVLLSTDDAAQYECHLAAFRDEYQPIGLRECELVQSIADTFWRLARIPCLEMAIFAKGGIEFADLFDEYSLAARPHLIDAHTFLVYEKQIRNLQLQEARLVRRREKETAELRKLQEERTGRSLPVVRVEEDERIQKEDNREAAPADGFEFSTTEFQAHPLPARAASTTQQPISNAATGRIIAHQAA